MAPMSAGARTGSYHTVSLPPWANDNLPEIETGPARPCTVYARR